MCWSQNHKPEKKELQTRSGQKQTVSFCLPGSSLSPLFKEMETFAQVTHTYTLTRGEYQGGRFKGGFLFALPSLQLVQSVAASQYFPAELPTNVFLLPLSVLVDEGDPSVPAQWERTTATCCHGNACLCLWPKHWHTTGCYTTSHHTKQQRAEVKQTNSRESVLKFS